MEKNPISREEYIDKVLSAYRRTPGTAGKIRRPDRLLAAQLQERGVPLMAVENALVLAAARISLSGRYQRLTKFVIRVKMRLKHGVVP